MRWTGAFFERGVGILNRKFIQKKNDFTLLLYVFVKIVH